MNEKLPYEKIISEKVNGIHLPDKEYAWQKMEKLLEDDDDDILIPPIFLKGCAGVLLLSGIVACIFFIFKPVNKSNSKDTVSTIANSTLKKQQTFENKISDSSKGSITYDLINENQITDKDSGNDPVNIKVSQFKKSKSLKRKILANQSIKINFENTESSKENPFEKEITKNEIEKPLAENLNNVKHAEDNKLKNNLSGINADTTSVSNKAGGDTSKLKRNTLRRSIYYFSSGITLQQQIPFNGQKPVPYNYYGRKGSLGDYIPSVHARVYKNNKWFLQGELRFGAPQYIKEFTYNDDTVFIGSNPTNRRRALTLKKTYYHQLSISVNHFVNKNWSMGTGLMYSKFFGAVAEQVIKGRNVITQVDTIFSKSVIHIKNNTDSFFTRSQLNYFLETQYRFKKFSTGLRYTKGLQPYIKYADPAGKPAQQKNQSLQFFIHYELWKSKK